MKNEKEVDYNHYHGSAQIICDKPYGYFLYRVDGGTRFELWEKLEPHLRSYVYSSAITRKALDNEA